MSAKDLFRNVPQLPGGGNEHDAAIDVFMYVGGNSYEVQAFETEFQRLEDFKGQPQHEAKGGLLSITLKQRADETLNEWMFKPGVSHSGEIHFSPISRMSNPYMKVIFEEAICIGYEKMGGVGIGLQLRILISPKNLVINNVKHSNRSPEF